MMTMCSTETTVEYAAPTGRSARYIPLLLFLFTCLVPRARAVPERPTNPTLTAAQLRAAALYSGGEFSTFPHRRPEVAAPHYETVKWTPPFERRIEDEWIAFDKAQHFAFSFLWTLGTQYVAVNKGGLTEHRALPISITTSAAIGVTKEYYDLHAGPTQYFSVRDLVADAAGILLAVGVIGL